MADVGEFNLVIEKGPASDSGAELFAQAFGLDPALTRQMLRATPLLFASHLTKAEVKALVPRLQELSKQGMDFRITTRGANMAKVNWPVRPNFALPATTSAGTFTIDFHNTAFVCPTCGDAYVFTRLGRIPWVESAEPAAAPAAAPVEKKSTGRVPAVSINLPIAEVKRAAPEPPRAPAEVPSNKPTEPLPVNLELEESVGANPNFAPPGFAEADLVEPLSDEELEAGEVAKEPPPQIDLSNIEEPATRPSQASNAKTSMDLSGALDDSLAEQAQREAEAAASGAAPSNQELFNVFVPQVSDKTKLEEVVRLVASIRGVSEEEARKLAKRLMIPVAKGVSKDTAEKILGQFKKLKMTGRMTRVAPGALATE
jgi:ribosomal protein L7/L12